MLKKKSKGKITKLRAGSGNSSRRHRERKKNLTYPTDFWTDSPPG